MRLTFHGAAREVTGSCFRVQTGAAHFLVDCGLFQGGGEAAQKNRHALDFDVSTLDFVLLTHAHLDHSGLLPRLIAFGYSGPVYATAATADLLEVMLADAAYIQEREAQWRRRAGKREEPLYTAKEAALACASVQGVAYDQNVCPHPSVRCRFRDAGHILGSAIIEVWVNEDDRQCKMVFSGDLGQPGHPIVRDPAPIGNADVLVVESTYGNRTHRNMQQTLDEFVHVVTDTLERRRGNVVIPAFAVGRTQDLLYLIVKLYRQKRLPALDVYVDSPMATAATAVTLKHLTLADEDAKEAMQWMQSGSVRPRIRFIDCHNESQALADVAAGAVIIAASGMCEAGRIKHHLRTNLSRPECSVIFTGFQAQGTLGRRIVDGAKIVRIFGQPVEVKAAIHTIGGLSAHADRDALLGWLSGFESAPGRTFVVHGEAAVAEDFAASVRARLGWHAVAPDLLTGTEI